MQQDSSEIKSHQNVKQFIVKKVDSLDVRNIGGFEVKNFFGNTQHAIYRYYRPKGRGKHYVSISKENSKIINGEGYFKINIVPQGVFLSIENAMTNEITNEINGRKLRFDDLEQMANDRGLECAYIRNFVL